MSDTEPVSLDLTPAEEPVFLRGRDGTSKEYVLREVSGEGGTAYQNAVNDAMIIVDGKVKGYRNMEQTEALLVSHCLFQVRPDDKNLHDKLVPVQTIEKWPLRVRRDLFKRAEKLSGLADESRVTVESIKKEIERLQARLVEMEKEPPNPNS